MYRVRVRASDGRGVGRLDVVVTVTDLDEAPEIDGESNPNVREGSTRPVGTYTATDPEGKDVFWGALEGTDAVAFTLDERGRLNFLSPPDHEAQVRYEVTLVVSECTPGYHHRHRPHNQVPPSSSRSRTSTSLRRSWDRARSPTKRKVRAGSGEYRASDPEGENTRFVWTLSGPDRNAFRVVDGFLTFAAPPDFDDPADSLGNNEYSVTVEARDEKNRVGSLDVLVAVTNINDPPALTGGPSSRSVPENTTGTVATYTATDPERLPIRWSVEGADASDFVINESGQLMFGAPPGLRNKVRPPDHGGCRRCGRSESYPRRDHHRHSRR